MSVRMRNVLVAAAFAAVLVASATGWLYSRNALFRLTEIRVLAEDSDLAATARRRLTGLLGRSLFAVSLASVERELKELPAVKSLGIHRRWPSTLVISLETKKPVALAFRQGKLWSLDAEGSFIEPVTRPLVLPLMKSFPDAPETREVLFSWLARARAVDSSALDFSMVDELSWGAERGLMARAFDPPVEIELGFRDFDLAWNRADQAMAVLKTHGVRPSSLDATYRHRVVVRPLERLRNFPNELNLKELVRRAGEDSPKAR